MENPYDPKLIENFNTLAIKYGQKVSISKGESLDSQLQEIPWYTYPAIEYLDNIDFKFDKVFEYGSGNSTVWWAKRANSITSIEDDENWFHIVEEKLGKLKNKINYLFEKEETYIENTSVINSDIVIIDGGHRTNCAKYIIKLIERNGFEPKMIIFDNSDWYPSTIEYFRTKSEYLQIDFHGFGPINGYTWTTSIFFNPKKVSQISYKNKLKSVSGLEDTAREDFDI